MTQGTSQKVESAEPTVQERMDWILERHRIKITAEGASPNFVARELERACWEIREMIRSAP